MAHLMLVLQRQGAGSSSSSSRESSLSYAIDDDEESQLSSAIQSGVEQPPIEQPPSVLDIPPQEFRLHSDDADDAQVISSIIGNIKNSTVFGALANIIKDPLSARQINIKHESQASLQLTKLTTTNILYDGLLFAGFDHERLQNNNLKRKTEWFKALYGAEQTSVCPYLIIFRRETRTSNDVETASSHSIGLLSMTPILFYRVGGDVVRIPSESLSIIME